MAKPNVDRLQPHYCGVIALGRLVLQAFELLLTTYLQLITYPLEVGSRSKLRERKWTNVLKRKKAFR